MKPHNTNSHYFIWQGIDATGTRVNDAIYAPNRQEAIKALTTQKIQIREIKQGSPPSNWLPTRQATNKEITLFTRQLATMLNAGLSLTMSLALILANQEKTAMHLITTKIKLAIEEGTSLSVALKDISPLFDEIYISLISSAELSGQLAPTLERIAIYREKNALQKSKQAKAIVYPVIVIGLAFAISYIMLTTVIPEFEQMFVSFNAPLPWFTQQIIALSDWLSVNAINHVFLLLTAIIVLKFLIHKSTPFRLIVDRSLLSLPIMGAIVSKSILARYCRSLAVAVRSGIPVTMAIQNTANVAGNLSYKRAFEQLFDDITTGSSIYTAMKTKRCFPNLMVQMIMVGEQSGTLDKMLDKIADIYDTELEQTIDKMGILIEPFLIIFLGIIIGGLVVAIYLPIFNMMNILG